MVDGPYPFLRIRKQSLFTSILWGVIIIGGSYLIAYVIYKLNKKKGAKI